MEVRWAPTHGGDTIFQDDELAYASITNSCRRRLWHAKTNAFESVSKKWVRE